eukprot:Gb_14185 [translate_table: standard]
MKKGVEVGVKTETTNLIDIGIQTDPRKGKEEGMQCDIIPFETQSTKLNCVQTHGIVEIKDKFMPGLCNQQLTARGSVQLAQCHLKGPRANCTVPRVVSCWSHSFLPQVYALIYKDRVPDLQLRSLLTNSPLIRFDEEQMEVLYERSNRADQNLITEMFLANDLCKNDLEYNLNVLMESVHLRAPMSMLTIHEDKLITIHEKMMEDPTWRIAFEGNLETILNLWEEGLPLILHDAKTAAIDRVRHLRELRMRMDCSVNYLEQAEAIGPWDHKKEASKMPRIDEYPGRNQSTRVRRTELKFSFLLEVSRGP